MEMLAASDRAFGFLGDDFSVDDLLIEPEGSDDQEAEEAVSSEGCNLHTSPTASSSAATCDQLLQNPAMELDFHTEDGAELEWLSQFVDDSFFEFPSYVSENNSQSDQSSASPKTNLLTERRIIVPVRARSKRSRKFSSACTKSPGVIMFETEPTKEKKKRGRRRKHQLQSDTRCSHCGVEKTPQWRAGPTGAKTLCNACGVRFKSGRLLPEYRPACSPTFVGSIHSNSHRKVLELRRKKAEEEERVV